MLLFQPKIPVIATVLAVHGLGEHIQRYDHIFSVFAEHGIMVKGIDYRGHGRTLKKNATTSIPGYHTSFEQIWADLLQLQDMAVEGIDTPRNLPTFVMGHSLGGLLALTFAFHNDKKIHNLAGVICQGRIMYVVIIGNLTLFKKKKRQLFVLLLLCLHR